MYTRSLINHLQLINSSKQICCISTPHFKDFGHLEVIPFLFLLCSTYFFPRKLWLNVLLESLMIQHQGLYLIQSTASINCVTALNFQHLSESSGSYTSFLFSERFKDTNIKDYFVKYALAYHIIFLFLWLLASPPPLLLYSSLLHFSKIFMVQLTQLYIKKCGKYKLELFTADADL